MQCNMGSIITKLIATMSLLCAFVFFGAFPTHERMTNATLDLIRCRIFPKDKLLALSTRTILDQRARSFELMRCHVLQSSILQRHMPRPHQYSCHGSYPRNSM